MPGILTRLKNKLSDRLYSEPKSSPPNIGPTRRDRANDDDWEDIHEGPERCYTDPSYANIREFNLPGGPRVAITHDSSSPRSSRDHFSLTEGPRHSPRSARDRTSIYDPKRSRDLFSSPRSSRNRHSRSRDGSRGRERTSEPRRSGDGQRRRRRKSSHPKELSRHRSDSRVNEDRPVTPPIPPLSLGGMFGALRIFDERADDRGRGQLAGQFQADKDHLRRQQREIQKQFEDDWEKQKRLEKEKDIKAKEAAKAAERRVRKQMEEDTARKRRERKAREKEDAERRARAQPRGDNSVPLTAANLTAARDNSSDSGDSAKSALNRGIGNMQRTIIEGMLPAEEVLKEERRRREEAVRKRGGGGNST